MSAKGATGQSPLAHACSDGEDFELILAVPPDSARKLSAEQPLAVPLTMIGEFIDKSGLFALDTHGKFQPFTPRGYEHRLDS